ncbi:chemotaxis protein CheA [Leeia oryzae]|uniref:chemotaxis protein CheA n=1 Tax=Leeia oryzae TaxID=356662 RepID=UPI000362D484|nr:chemotaxis protein CheA [Leeia oryzae]
MSMEEALQTFFAESHELLQEMEDRLLAIPALAEEDRSETINAIFRAAHTIKGSAGLFGLDGIVEFTHVLESVLDKVRAGQLMMDADMVSLFLDCKDHVARLVELQESGATLSTDDQGKGNELVARLSVYLTDTPQAAVAPAGEASHPAPAHPTDSLALESLGGNVLDNDNWHISIEFGTDVLRNGMDPLSIFRYLGTMGHIVRVVSFFDRLPALSELDPESCYMSYVLNFHSEADKATIESAFEFVQEDCKINILPPHSRVADFVEAIKNLKQDDLRIGEMLVKSGTLTQRELDAVLAYQTAQEQGDSASQDPHKRPLGEMVVQAGIVQPEVVEAALHKQIQQKKAKSRQQQSIRVDAEKLDTLINLIGELVIAGAGVNIVAHRSGQTDMLEAASTLSRLVEEVRDSALNLRMVQIGETFNRFQRVVHDVAKDLGKEIELEITGGDTELDKTVVEKIGDPLTHLVRNSIDHGIEPADIRAARGKPAQGKVRLNAYHDSGSIIIEVQDDGGGLNRDKILAKAIEKGLVEPGIDLPDSEVYQLIFEAGFSTADKVSNISGRGVGMDVVRRNIEALRGNIEIDSQYMAGTTIRIRLPLTLAIIDGFQVKVGNAHYVIPLDMVIECVDLPEENINDGHDSNYFSLRGEVLPYMRLRESFEVTGETGKRESVVIVKYGNTRAGLVVDALLGEFQTVIKPLGKLFERLRGIGGSTILGTGEVALILDIPGLVQQMIRKSHHETSRASVKE